jgi:hypothetical protein
VPRRGQPQEVSITPKSHNILCRGLLFFWSAWFSIVFASNLADGLQQAGLLPETWRFASGNFGLIVQSIEIFSLEKAWAVILFGGVLITQLGVSVLFWRAFLIRASLARPVDQKVVQAFALGIGLFAAFLVADEILVVYHRFSGLETTHFLILCALLLSYLVIDPHRSPLTP